MMLVDAPLATKSINPIQQPRRSALTTKLPASRRH
jgi:hypothetical protein